MSDDMLGGLDNTPTPRETSGCEGIVFGILFMVVLAAGVFFVLSAALAGRPVP